MLHSQKSKRAFTTFVVIAALVGITALLFVAIPASSSAAGSGPERKNYRISVRGSHGQTQAGSDFARRSRVTLRGPMVPVASITVDRTDDTFAASACTAAANDCSLRGAVNFANSNPGTTINVPAGTYNLTISGAGEGFNGDDSVGDLDITADGTTISGAGAATTIIRQTQSGDRVIEVNPFLDPNFNTSISDVTISGGTESTAVGGGGIISGSIDNSLTLTNCIISGNSATGAGTSGGGGVSHLGGSLTITGCTFSSNSTSSSGGGLSYSAGDPFGRTPSLGTLTISGSSFTTNTANSSAAGGGAADLFDFNGGVSTYNVDSSTFSSNVASNGSGGAIIVESGGPLTVSTSSFTTNHAANSGGAILSSGTVASVRYSRLVGNFVTVPTNGRALFRSTGIFTAEDNWWGINSGPAANDFRSTSGSVFPTTFLKLQASGNPNTICTGATSNIAANIKQRNVGADLTVELNGLPAFAATFVNATPALGNLSGVSANFVDGSASATFTAGATSGTANIDVTADSQTVTASVVVQTNATSDPADQAVCEGGTATFSTTASGPGPFTFVWKKGATVLNNGDLGGRVTITSGSGASTLSISSVQSSDADTYTVEATGSCSTATQSATLTVNAATSATTPADQTVCQGVSASFSTTAGGTGPFHYAWTVDGSSFDGDSASINVPTGSLTVGNHPVSVTVTGACGSDTKNATLTVQASTTTTDPPDQTVCQGASAGFATTAGGTGPFHYAWTLDGSPFNGDNASISVNTTSLSVGNHTVAVTTTGTCGSASQSATLTVQANTATSAPANQTVCPGTNANFSTTASGTGPFHYAWKLDGSPFNGDSPSISVPTGSLSSGNHTVSVTTTGTCGSASQTATLTVQQNTGTTDPPDQNVCLTGTAVFSTAASGTGPFSFVWKKGATVLHNGDLGGRVTIANGSSASTLTISNVQAGDVGAYSVETTGACGTATQSSNLTVNSTPPTISCLADIIADFDPAVNGAVVTYTPPVGTDTCPGATTTQTAGLPSGSTFPLGTTTNTFRVTDSTGQSAECSFKVTVALTSIIGLDSVSITGSGLVDSYDSSIGYPASKGSLANILSNGTITLGGSGKVFGNVRSTRAGVVMTGTTQVTGNATAGTTVSKGASAVIGGTITNNALAPVMTLPSVPACSPFSSNSGITGTYSYNAGTGDLSLSGVNIATLANGTYCFHNVTLTNSGQLKVNGPVTIKLTGTLSTSGATSLPNTTLIPSNLRILSSFSGSNGVTFGNSASLQLVVYAPQTGVNISGSAPLFGTVAGKTITLGNSGMIHYDTQLKSVWPDIWTLIFGP